MKKIVLLIAMAFTVSLMVAQSPCCNNKAKGVSCTHSTQEFDATKTVDGNKVLAACCKGKAEQGLSCCKNKQTAVAPSCSSKKWWQVWKKGCDKPYCAKG
jgi:hypothetical protein